MTTLDIEKTLEQKLAEMKNATEQSETQKITPSPIGEGLTGAKIDF